MYKRDLITSEIQKLAEALARIMGLKLEGKLTEANAMFEEALQRDFGLSSENLLLDTNDEFKIFLTEKAFPAEKLEMLSQFLYAEFQSSDFTVKNDALAEKLLVIYEMLEVKYHIVNMANLSRQKTIQQYLNS